MSESKELINFLLSHYPSTSIEKKVEKYVEVKKQKKIDSIDYMAWFKRNILVVLLFILLCVVTYKTYSRR